MNRYSEPREYALWSPAYASVFLPECENPFSPARERRDGTILRIIPRFFEANECVRHALRRSEPREFAPRGQGRIINKYLPTGIHSHSYPAWGAAALGRGAVVFWEEAPVIRRKMIFALRMIFLGAGEPRHYIFVEVAPVNG